MDATLDRELKKGSAELLILASLEGRPRHGYEVAKRIADESGGAIRFNVASLYGLLYRLESRGWIRGRWIEAPNERRRRAYALTATGREASDQPLVAGVYPMRLDETCHFRAVDFDKAGWEAEAIAFVGGCRRRGLAAALERSRPGRGGHVPATAANGVAPRGTYRRGGRVPRRLTY